MKSLTRFFAVAFLTAIVCIGSAFAQQTQVGHLSGGVAVLDVSSSTLLTAFNDQTADGTVHSSLSIQYDGTDYYLTAIGTKNGVQQGSGVALTNTGGNLTIKTSGGFRVCQGINNSCTCRFTPVCWCHPDGNGSCTFSESPSIGGYLGSFY
ncbi:MAG: hypothetical protein JST20_10720 [Bacteroidetes bacterium]|nr:hypothetical protein [Bacteroidota bacterium]